MESNFTKEIISCCYSVHKYLGNGFLEKVYCDALEIEFQRKSISFVREKKYQYSIKKFV